MRDVMMTFVGSIITPALVASLFSILFNARNSKRKDLRDALSKRLEENRVIISSAVKAAAEYYSKDADNRTPALEATLWMAEREVRLGLSTLTSTTIDGLQPDFEKLQHDFDFFVAELTGSNFGQNNATVDLAHIRRVAGLGAELRQSISRTNESELQSHLDNDILSKLMRILQISPYRNNKIN